MYVGDEWSHVIRRVSPTGDVTTLAGYCYKYLGIVTCDSGSQDGSGTNARFKYPYGIVADPFSSSVYIADSVRLTRARRTAHCARMAVLLLRLTLPSPLQGNNAIRVLDSRTQEVRTLAGGNQGTADGVGSLASFNRPYGLAMDYAGAVYVGDSLNNCIRKITPANAQVETFAGTCGQAGMQDGMGTSARFNGPAGIAFDPVFNAILVADYSNNRIRSIDMSTRAVTTLAGSGTAGYIDEFGTNAQFNGPSGVAPDGQGGVYTIELGGLEAGLLRHLDNFAGPRLVSTLAGLSGGTWVGGYSDGVGTAARFDGPRALAVDASGRQIWIADTYNDRIRYALLPPSPPSPPIKPTQCPPPGFDSVKEFDLETYTEQPWFVIQQSPNSYQPVDKLFCVRAEYRIVEHDLDVDPSALYVFNQARTGSVDGPGDGIDSLLSAVVVNGPRGQLKVGPSFVPPEAYGPYWVEALGEVEAGDKVSYEWAIVSGGPPMFQGANGKCRNAKDTAEGNGEGLWIFSRTPTMDPNTLTEIRGLAESLGFDTSVLQNVEQKGCNYFPWPTTKAAGAVPRSALLNAKKTN